MLPRTEPSDPLLLVGAAFSLPLFSLFVAVLIGLGLLVAKRMRVNQKQVARSTPQEVEARYTPERRMLGIAAISFVALFAVENIVRGYFLDLSDVVSWWRYALPLFGAIVTIAALLCLIVFRGSAPPAVPALTPARRTWTTFAPRTALWGAAISILALLTTTITSGLASSAGREGQFMYIEITIPNTDIDPVRTWFYGWAYGVPVLVCLGTLVVVSWAALRSNAVRPFIRPETVAAEQIARLQIATGILRLTTAAVLLALAGAWRLIASAGSIGRLYVENTDASNTYELSWQHSEFALAAGWLSPLVEIAGFFLLLLVAYQLLRTRSLRPAPENAPAGASQ